MNGDERFTGGVPHATVFPVMHSGIGEPMPSEKNPLEIYRILPGTNCGRCFLPSCLAFAAAVVSGAKKPGDCPFVGDAELAVISPNVVTVEPYEIQRGQTIDALREQVAGLDLAARAERLGGRTAGDHLSISCLGKEFFIDREGKVRSECHTHAGLTIPLLSYIVTSSGEKPAGDWVPFRELRDARPMSALFGQRGETRLQALADQHTDLFADLVGMFSGAWEKTTFDADTSLVLYPLPLLPVLICYWLPEDGLASRLGIFFDRTADRHLPVEYVFELTVGMVMMFEKIAGKHA
ncbi:MAG: hypothetical protein Kow0089_20110 [Desulfobulbaceae bacterium]